MPKITQDSAIALLDEKIRNSSPDTLALSFRRQEVLDLLDYLITAGYSPKK